jgi:hypothetical protein
MKIIFPLLTPLSFIFSLLTASIAAAGGNQGTLEVRVKDHREAIGDFAHLNLKLEEILISPKPGLKFWQTGWKHLAPIISSVDLTRYVGKNSVRVFRGSIDAGSFDAIHLKLKEVSGVLNKSRRNGQIKNLVGPIKLAFAVHAQGETLIVLDLVVLDMSDHPPQAYELGVKGYEIYSDGQLVDKVPPG